MNTAIVIGSYVGSPWLAECVASLPRDIPTIVVCEPNYECGKIGWAWRNTNLEEFLFLPDTVVVKRHEWIREIFAAEGSSIAITPEPGPFGCFMGKFRRQILNIVDVPHTPTKRDAVDAEAAWTRLYAQVAGQNEDGPVRTLFPEFQHGPNPARIETKHGRPNAVIENNHLIKWKGTWNGCMIDGTERRDAKLVGRL